MRDRGMGDAPEETQETEAQPFNADLEAWAAPALKDLNSQLEVPLMPERASAYSKHELLSLINAGASHYPSSSTTEER